MRRKNILIVDDLEINRFIYKEILKNEYSIHEAGNYNRCFEVLKSTEIDLIILDLVMPHKDGFDILLKMNDLGYIDTIPVLVISSEDVESSVDRAYALGAVDYIKKPLDIDILKERIENAFNLVNNKDYYLLNTLRHFNNIEYDYNGIHILHMYVLTKMLLIEIEKHNKDLFLTPNNIELISLASAFHDIGKTKISKTILNKTGKLTKDEFRKIQKHCYYGFEIIRKMNFTNPRLKIYAMEICKYHHERFDGMGYPYGLKNDNIPISAQVVGFVECYIALTSDRPYGRKFTHIEAVNILLTNGCGKFNPEIVNAFIRIENKIMKELKVKSITINDNYEISLISNKIKDYEMNKNKYDYLDENKKNIFYNEKKAFIFEHAIFGDYIYFSYKAMKILKLKDNVIKREELIKFIDESILKKIIDAHSIKTLLNPVYILNITLNGKNYRLAARTLWHKERPIKYLGTFGKVDLSNEC